MDIGVVVKKTDLMLSWLFDYLKQDFFNSPTATIYFVLQSSLRQGRVIGHRECCQLKQHIMNTIFINPQCESYCPLQCGSMTQVRQIYHLVLFSSIKENRPL